MESPPFDVARLRSHFPALADRTAYFDGPGGTQTPDVVAAAVAATLTSPLSNRGPLSVAERNADDAVLGARSALGDLLGADPQGIVFGRSMTALTLDVARTLASDWQRGDEVIVTRLDHDANVRPWVIAAERAGATVRFADFDTTSAELRPEAIGDLVNANTRLVAVTAASNLLGTMPDIATISEIVHRVGALLYVDGVHFTAHEFVDIDAMGADLFACSPYKFLGPHAGVLAARPNLLETLHPDKLLPATDDVPERFELGTLPYELMAGTTAAVDFLADIVPGPGTRRDRLERSLHAVAGYETDLRMDLEAALKDLPGTTLHSRATRRTPTLLVTFEQHDADDVARFLADRRVNAPAGSFYAYEPSRALGLGEPGGLRIGVAPYNDTADVDRLLDSLRAFLT